MRLRRAAQDTAPPRAARPEPLTPVAGGGSSASGGAAAAAAGGQQRPPGDDDGADDDDGFGGFGGGGFSDDDEGSPPQRTPAERSARTNDLRQQIYSVAEQPASEEELMALRALAAKLGRKEDDQLVDYVTNRTRQELKALKCALVRLAPTPLRACPHRIRARFTAATQSVRVAFLACPFAPLRRFSLACSVVSARPWVMMTDFPLPPPAAAGPRPAAHVPLRAR